MACERYGEALADVSAGLPAPAGLGAHLASCEACRKELHALRQALAMADAELAGLQTAEPSPELVARIRQAVADPQPGWRFGWLWPATATAATLLVALAVFLARGTPSAPESRMAVDASRPQSAGSTRTVGATGESVAPVGRPEPDTDGNGLDDVVTPRGDRPVLVADGIDNVVTPRSSRQAGRRGVRSGGSLGTRQARVPRDDRAFEPEVLVPPGEGEALQRFAAQLQRRAVAPDSLLVADLSAPLTEPRAVEIAPLEIIPLDPDEMSGSD